MLASSPLENTTFFVRTFGCQMNVHDSEHIEGVLEAAGSLKARRREDADFVIFNTCCVRQSAEDRVWGNLGAMTSEAKKPRVVAVTGCMAQMHGRDIFTRAPAVNLVFGTEALGRLPSLLDAATKSRVLDAGDIDSAQIDNLPSAVSESAQAWLPVSHGCDNWCSYCIVPRVRGRDRSRPLVDVIADAESLSSRGAVELVLLGQNVNSYGRQTGSSFGRLLEAVASLNGIERVKFETSHPRDLEDEVLDVMDRVPEVCEYLHLPVQSGSNSILRAMNRGYTREFYLELAARARERVSGLVLTTDIIVGFPGETDEDFEDTLDLVRRVQFDAAYMFIYSSREGTPAAAMEGEVPDSVKHERFDALCRVQEIITTRSLEKVVGTDVEIIATGTSKRGEMLIGRTRGNRVVLLPQATLETPVVRVHVDAAGRHSLRGTILG